MKATDYLVFAVLLLVISGGGYFLCLGLRNVWRGVASASWPRTTGTVVHSEMHAGTDVDRKTGHASTMYSADISFQYHVGAQDYTTKTLHFGQTLGSGSSADAEIRHLRYPEGAEVTIAYNPSHPEIATAEPGFNLESMWLIVAGLAFILPCVMAGVIVFQMEHNPDSEVGMAIGAGIFASIFAALGIAALCAGLTNLSRAHNSEHWPTAPGVIRYAKLQAEKVRIDTDDQQKQQVRDTDDNTTTSYSATVVYEFEVDGRKYFANVRRFGVLNGDLQQEGEAAERYPVGKEVQVAYSPVNPNVAVLEPGVQGATYALAGVGLACLLFASLVFIFVVPSMLKF
jgi:hypothetical protein